MNIDDYEDSELFPLPKRQVARIEQLDKNGPWQELGLSIYRAVGTGFLKALLGPRGTGKTQIAVNILHQAQKMKDISAGYATAMDVFVRLQDAFRKDSENSQDDVIRAFCRPKVLVLDEMQERGNTPWENRMLAHIIDKRYYMGNRDTLLLSNQTMDEFLTGVGPSVTSRLNETGEILVCNWASFRK